jgi:D-alanyl-D-alanine carboxypeptidase
MRKLFSIILALVLTFGTMSMSFASTKDIAEAKVPENKYLTLINRKNILPENWTFLFKFSVGKNFFGELYIVESKALEAFSALRAEVATFGFQIELDSVYRSLSEQQDIWDIWSADPELGPEYCEKYLAPVGCSEHHTGLAIDVFLIKDGQAIRDNDDMITDREDFAKIHAILAKYGFILRYPEGAEDITGYSYEPWHFRYIDDPDIAAYIMENNLTFEQYLEQNPQ